MSTFTCYVFAYDGAEVDPKFLRDSSGESCLDYSFVQELYSCPHLILGSMLPGFRRICQVVGDLSALSGSLVRDVGLEGEYWKLNYWIGIKFGGTELEAVLIWEEKVSLPKVNIVILSHIFRG